MLLLAVTAALVLCGPAPHAAADAEETRRIELALREAKNRGVDIKNQVRELALLAWPVDGHPTDPALAAAARAEIIGYSKHAMDPLSDVLDRADPVYSADVTLAMIDAARRLTEGTAPGLLRGLDKALWFGTVDAKRLAIQQFGMRKTRAVRMAIVDATYDHPELIPIAVQSLTQIGDDRARHYLGELLASDDEEHRRLAASALGKIGARCKDVLREGVLSQDPGMREAALSELLANTGLGDLTTLYEYVAAFPDDDPSLLEQVRQRAVLLEDLLERQRAADASSGNLDDE